MDATELRRRRGPWLPRLLLRLLWLETLPRRLLASAMRLATPGVIGAVVGGEAFLDRAVRAVRDPPPPMVDRRDDTFAVAVVRRREPREVVFRPPAEGRCCFALFLDTVSLTISSISLSESR